MNYLHNDRGQRVIAEGAPGSQARVRCEYPQLISELTEMRLKSKTPSAALGHIRKAVCGACWIMNLCCWKQATR